MARRLPNLNQLRAFEAAVRRGSFKGGAEELNVTQAAVSHSIKALEASLGVTMFRRGPREAVPTQAARRYAEALGEAFESVMRATDAIAARQAGPIRISVAPFHGNRWLIPKLAEFAKAHPDIPVEASLAFEMVDLAAGEYDAAVRFGHGDWAGHEARFVHDERLRPVATRGLLGGREPPLRAEEIAALPLLADAGHADNWARWFDAAGYEGPLPDQQVFNARPFVVDAVMSGVGAHLLDIRLTARNVAEGQLVYLSDVKVVSDMAYWMVRSEDTRPDLRLNVLTDWLAAEAAAI